jgi:hypothetical protein
MYKKNFAGTKVAILIDSGKESRKKFLGGMVND